MFFQETSLYTPFPIAGRKEGYDRGMNSVHPNKAGLAVGAFLGLVHIVWSVLVAVGSAQAVLDFIFRIHMVDAGFSVVEFSLGLAAILVVAAAVWGYIVGWVLATLWNWAHR